MRKLLFIIALMGSLACSAQQISLDKQEANGDRRIVTSPVIFTEGKEFMGSGATYTLYIQLDRAKKGGIYIDEYSIYVPQMSIIRQVLDSGRRLLLKLQNDSIVELANITSISEIDNTYRKTEYVDSYTMYPRYRVSPDQIQQIIKGNVKKLRVETNNGYYDIQANDKSKFWNFSLAVKMCYDCLLKEMPLDKDLHNGF